MNVVAAVLEDREEGEKNIAPFHSLILSTDPKATLTLELKVKHTRSESKRRRGYFFKL